jgi:protein phosphatase 4 regulatory subunit 3
MANLADIENTMRMAIHTATGRETLTKFIIQHDYVFKLCPLVTVAEDFESLSDLHRLCSIMKSIILLNDNTIMEMVVRDDLIEGVVGALECEGF